MTWWQILLLYIGYVGFTLAITTGEVFDGLREWLGGFSHPWNPLPFFGKLIGCSMCLGFWIGVVGDAFHPWYHGNEWYIRFSIHLGSGGLISLASYITDVVLRWIEATVTDKEVENEFVKQRLEAGISHQAPTEEGADVAAGGEPGE